MKEFKSVMLGFLITFVCATPCAMALAFVYKYVEDGGNAWAYAPLITIIPTIVVIAFGLVEIMKEAE